MLDGCNKMKKYKFQNKSDVRIGIEEKGLISLIINLYPGDVIVYGVIMKPI